MEAGEKNLVESGNAPDVGIIMGSDSDLPVMKAAAEVLDMFGISMFYEHYMSICLIKYEGIIMGSDSDLPVMKAAAEVLDMLGISMFYEHYISA